MCDQICRNFAKVTEFDFWAIFWKNRASGYEPRAADDSSELRLPLCKFIVGYNINLQFAEQNINCF